MVSVKAPLRSSMRTRSSPARASTAIRASLLRANVEVGPAVVADVDLQDAGPAGLQAKRDFVARSGARDRQHPVRALGVLEV